ncbi:MAG: hypothetical protein WC375_05505 [Methanomassiliicoccales archaeon]
MRDTGLYHELTPMGTISQGDLGRVVTYIMIDDRRDERPARRKMERAI